MDHVPEVAEGVQESCRSAALLARVIAHTAILALAAVVTIGIAFAVGFGFHGSAAAALAAFGLVLLFGFAFEWLFVALGLIAGNAQAAQGMGMIVFPFAFVSSAYVPASTMPSWLQVFAAHQPLTPMVDAVRALALGRPAGHEIWVALLWTLAILALSIPAAVARFRRG